MQMRSWNQLALIIFALLAFSEMAKAESTSIVKLTPLKPARRNDVLPVEITVDRTSLGGGTILVGGVDVQEVQSATLLFKCTTPGGIITKVSNVVSIPADLTLPPAQRQILNCELVQINVTTQNSVTLQFMLVVPLLESLGGGYGGTGTGSTISNTFEFPASLFQGGTFSIPSNLTSFPVQMNSVTLPNLSKFSIQLSQPRPISFIQGKLAYTYLHTGGTQSKIAAILELLSLWERFIVMLLHAHTDNGGTLTSDEVANAAAKCAVRQYGIDDDRRQQAQNCYAEMVFPQ